MASSGVLTWPFFSARNVLFLLFFLSGTASLIYEVVWTRWLTDVLGSASGATAIVLAVFMAGLGIGNWLASQVADRTARPIRVYGILELAIVVLAILPAWEAVWMASTFARIAHSWGPESPVLNLARIVAAAIAVGPPAILMGATFPLMVRSLARDRQLLGSQTAAAYATNSFGGVCGTLLAGFLLIEMLGLRGAGLVAASLGVSAGLLAVWLDWHTDVATDGGARTNGRPRKSPAGNRRRRHGSRSRWSEDAPSSSPLVSDSPAATRGTSCVLLAAAMSGFCALGYETIWMRILSVMTLNTTYAFSLILAIMLLGLSLGGWLVWLMSDKLSRPAEWFAAIQILLSVYALSSLFWIPLVDDFTTGLFSTTQAALIQPWFGKPMILALCLLLLPATFMGASLPIVCKLYGTFTQGVGRPVGHIYAANTFGSMLGPIVLGLIIAPSCGTWWAVVICSLVGATAAAGVGLGYVQKPLRRAYSVAACAAMISSLAIGITYGGSAIGRLDLRSDETVVFRSEDAGGIVEVVEDFRLGTRWLLTNRLHWEGSNLPRAVWDQRKQGLLPLVLHPSPRRVLEIGVGTGIKLGVLDCPLVEKAVAIEISPAVIEASKFFSDYNHGIVGDGSRAGSGSSKVRVVCSDGRNFVALTPDRYDLIVNGLLTPYRAGVSRLYTVEHFRNCRQKLAADGMFVAWVAMRQIDPQDLKVLVRTLLEVFPHTTMWLDRRYLALIAPTQPLVIDAEEIQRRFDNTALKQVLEEAGMDSPLSLLSGFVAGPETLRNFSRGYPLNTENRPIIEFRTPKLGDQLNSQSLGAKNLDLIASLQDPLCPKYVTAGKLVRAHIQRAQEARWLAREALVLKYEGQHIQSAQRLNEALAKDPNDSLAQFEMEIYLVAHAKECLRRGFVDQARRVFRKAAQVNPRSIGAIASLAAIEAANGNPDGASELWEQVRAIDPHNRAALRELAQLRGDAVRR